MAGRAFGVAPIPSAHLRHREATGVAIAERSSVTRDAGMLERFPELPRDERPGADPLFEGGTNTWPSAANSPNGGRSPRLNARSVGRPTCANTRRLTPARLATLATVCTSRCPPTPPTNRIGRAHPAPSANMRSASRAHGEMRRTPGPRRSYRCQPGSGNRRSDDWCGPLAGARRTGRALRKLPGMRDEALLGGQSPDGGDESRAPSVTSHASRVPGGFAPGPPSIITRTPAWVTRRPAGAKRRGLRADTQRHEPHG